MRPQNGGCLRKPWLASPYPVPHRREQRPGSAHQRQHHRRILRRVRAAGLRHQRRRNQHQHRTSQKHNRRSLHPFPPINLQTPTPQGRAPILLFITAVAIGVTTGTAAPTNSTTLLPLAKLTGRKASATHTFPELSRSEERR